MNLLITGVSGQLGQALVKRLMKSNPFDRTFGLDKVTPNVLGPAHFIEADLRHADIGDLLVMNDIQVVIHLAASPIGASPGVDTDIVRRLLDVTEPAGLKRLVIPSRNWVYTRADTPRTEDSPIRQPSSGGGLLKTQGKSVAAWFGWGHVQTKLQIESMIAQYRTRDDRIPVVVPRLCAVVGPARDRPLDAVLSSRFIFGPWSYEPMFQFLDESDAAQLILACGSQDALDGPYNVAGPEPISLTAMAGILEKKVIRLPGFLIRLVVTGLSRFGLLGFRFGDLVRLQLGMPMSTSRASQALGTPKLTSRQALALWRAQGYERTLREELKTIRID